MYTFSVHRVNFLNHKCIQSTVYADIHALKPTSTLRLVTNRKKKKMKQKTIQKNPVY